MGAEPVIEATLHPMELILSPLGSRGWDVSPGTEIPLQRVAVWASGERPREGGIGHKSCLTPSVLKRITLQGLLESPFRRAPTRVSYTPHHSRGQRV